MSGDQNAPVNGVPTRRDAPALIGSGPAILGLGLACIYSLGALSWVAALIDAQVSIMALTEIPIEQMLARGIIPTLVVALIAPGLLLTVYLGARLDRSGERRQQELERRKEDLRARIEHMREHPEEVTREALEQLDADVDAMQPDSILAGRRGAVILSALAVIAVAVVLITPVFVLPLALLSIPLLWVAFRLGWSWQRMYTVSALCSLVAAITVAIVVPRPLPRAVVSTDDGDTLVGRLVVYRADALVLTPSRRHLITLPSDSVKKVATDQRSRGLGDWKQSLAEVIGIF